MSSKEVLDTKNDLIEGVVKLLSILGVRSALAIGFGRQWQ